MAGFRLASSFHRHRGDFQSLRCAYYALRRHATHRVRTYERHRRDESDIRRFPWRHLAGRSAYINHRTGRPPGVWWIHFHCQESCQSSRGGIPEKPVHRNGIGSRLRTGLWSGRGACTAIGEVLHLRQRGELLFQHFCGSSFFAFPLPQRKNKRNQKLDPKQLEISRFGRSVRKPRRHVFISRAGTCTRCLCFPHLAIKAFVRYRDIVGFSPVRRENELAHLCRCAYHLSGYDYSGFQRVKHFDIL